MEAEDRQLLKAAQRLGSTLVNDPMYRRFEDAQAGLQDDAAAGLALRNLQERQRKLGWRLQMGVVPPEEQAALRELEQQVMRLPAIQACVTAQEELSGLCRELNEVISGDLGSNSSPTPAAVAAEVGAVVDWSRKKGGTLPMETATREVARALAGQLSASKRLRNFQEAEVTTGTS